jgi:ribosomal protein S20
VLARETIMAANLTSLSNNGIAAGQQQLPRAGSERQVQKEVGDLGKALESNDVVAAQSVVASLRSAAPNQNGRTDFQNAVKALDQALKANDAKGATEAFAALQQAQPRRPQAAPGREAPAQETRQIQQSNQSQQTRQVAERDFLTRQDLAAKAAAGPEQEPPGRGVGLNVDTRA